MQWHRAVTVCISFARINIADHVSTIRVYGRVAAIGRDARKLLQAGAIISAAAGPEAWANPPARHVVIERLPGFDRADEQERIWLPERMLRRELGATPIENIRWVTQQSRILEPEIKRHAVVLVDISATSHEDVVDGALYAYTLWGRSDIRRIMIRRESWVLAGDNEERARTPVPGAELAELQLLGMVIGWL